MYSVVVMDEGNIAAKAGVKDGVSYVEKKNLGTLTAKKLITLRNLKPFQTTEKSMYCQVTGTGTGLGMGLTSAIR